MGGTDFRTGGNVCHLTFRSGFVGNHTTSRQDPPAPLYAGRDDETSLDACVRSDLPELAPHLVALDMDQPYSDLCLRALAGQIAPALLPYVEYPLLDTQTGSPSPGSTDIATTL